MLKPHSIHQITEHFLEEKRKGKDFSEIRKELIQYKLSEDEIKMILREIDRQVFQDEVNAIGKQGANERIWIGVILILIGLIFTIGTYKGMFNTGKYIVLLYGPIIGGIITLISGLKRNKKQSDSQSKMTSGYFRKRT